MKSDISAYRNLPWEMEADTNMTGLYPMFINSKHWKDLKGKDDTLDYIIEWINQGVQCSQIDLVYNYIKLICKLALNKKWKPAVDSTFSRLLDSLLEMNTGNEQKILNFLCSLIFTPVIVFSGQWIEYKDSDSSSSDSSSTQQQQIEYRNALLKCQFYDDGNNGFNLTLIDLISRNCRYLKGLQNDIHFKRAVNITQFDCLQLSLDNCSKLIKLYKKLLTFNSNNQNIRYINLKQLSLKHNLILLYLQRYEIFRTLPNLKLFLKCISKRFSYIFPILKPLSSY
jgi:hypothetical protein